MMKLRMRCPASDTRLTTQSRLVGLKMIRRPGLLDRQPSFHASKNIPCKENLVTHCPTKPAYDSHLKALERDSGVEEEFDPFDTTVSTTGSPLSFADEMSLSLFDRRLFSCKLFNGISPDDCGDNGVSSSDWFSLSVWISSDSSKSSEILFLYDLGSELPKIASITGFLERGVIMLSCELKKFR